MELGGAVTISGSTVVVDAPGTYGPGAACIFEVTPTVLTSVSPTAVHNASAQARTVSGQDLFDATQAAVGGQLAAIVFRTRPLC